MSQKAVTEILSKADIEINGTRPWDIKVLDDRFYDRVMAEASLGTGEAYVEGWWECAKIDQMIEKALRAKTDLELFSWKFLIDAAAAKLRNPQAKWRSFRNASHHYDIGDDLYKRMLGKWMVYSCAYWKGVSNVDRAQEQKMELICKKIGLKKGMSLLDIGCGWGVFAKYAATRYKAKVVGITVSKNQFQFAKKHCAKLPVKILLQDYRDLQGKFDRIVSIGMFEHVGYKNYAQYMKVAHRSLKDHGLFLLQSIGNNHSKKQIDPWIQKYIFPNAMLPSIEQIGAASEKYFVMEDWHNFGPYYDKTLMAWYANFKKHWPEIKKKYGERFYRMWRFYLLSCAGAFRSREIQLWQVLFSKNGVSVPYLR